MTVKRSTLALVAAAVVGAGGLSAGVVAATSTGTVYGCVGNSAPQTIIDVDSVPKCPSGNQAIALQGTIGNQPSPSPTLTSPSATPTSPTPTVTPTSPSASPTSTSVPVGTVSCMYGPDTWSGDSVNVGYTVSQVGTPVNGKLSSFSVSINAKPGTTEVVGYPSDQCLTYAALPASLSSSFDQTPPANSAGLDYEFAYDIWLTTAANATSFNWSGDLELMIWTYNNGQRPAGSDIGALADGSRVWTNGNNTTGIVTVVLPQNETTGTVSLSGIISQLKAAGWIASSITGYLDVEYGIEAPYGGGQTFTVNGFSLTSGAGIHRAAGKHRVTGSRVTSKRAHKTR